jgi:hypothetical protein
VWVERGRAKKLIVAFHFLRTDQTRWKCDACRQQGLERRRRCGFLAEDQRGEARLVWANGRAGVDECPKSFTTAASAEMVERFALWKASGGGDWQQLNARDADAFQVLDEEWRNEARDGK